MAQQQMASYRAGSSIRLYPWQDDLDAMLPLLSLETENQTTMMITTTTTAGNEIKNVYIFFEGNRHNRQSNDEDILALFDAIANGLPKLESVIVKMDQNEDESSKSQPNVVAADKPPSASSPSFWFPLSFSSSNNSIETMVSASTTTTTSMSSTSSSVATLPIPALTSLFHGENNNKLQYLTMIGLDLYGDDYDMNGWAELIRIRGRGALHSLVMKHCKFASERHLQLIRAAFTEREGMKHCDLLDNSVSCMPMKNQSIQQQQRQQADDNDKIQKQSDRFGWQNVGILIGGSVVVLAVTIYSLMDSTQRKALISYFHSGLSWLPWDFSSSPNSSSLDVNNHLRPKNNKLPGILGGLLKKLLIGKRNSHP